MECVGQVVNQSLKRSWCISCIALSVLLIAASPANAGSADPDNGSFQEWLAGIQAEAKRKGFKQSTLQALENIEPDPRVLKFDKRQPEFVQTFEEYLEARVTPYRINTARKYFTEHRQKLTEIGAAYNVDPEYILAFWGLESNFGKYQGTYSIIRSLATLGHDPRRSRFFTRELFNALQILDEGHVTADKFVGGWAGAMGQNQFMPSSFLNYAQDFDGDGKKNIWGSQVDVWASIANYLKKNSWREGEIWGLRVTLTQPIDFESLRPVKVRSGCRAYKSHTKTISIDAWRKMGVEIDTAISPETQFAMVIPAADETFGYLVGPNFSRILAYNCANKYAVSIGLMADEILK